MLVVGILGLVPKTTPLNNFLIFVACVWSFCSNARKSLSRLYTELTSSIDHHVSQLVALDGRLWVR